MCGWGVKEGLHANVEEEEGVEVPKLSTEFSCRDKCECVCVYMRAGGAVCVNGIDFKVVP